MQSQAATFALTHQPTSAQSPTPAAPSRPQSTDLSAQRGVHAFKAAGRATVRPSPACPLFLQGMCHSSSKALRRLYQGQHHIRCGQRAAKDRAEGSVLRGPAHKGKNKSQTIKIASTDQGSDLGKQVRVSKGVLGETGRVPGE